MKRKLFAGTTSVSLPIFVQDTSSTTGGGLAGLTSSTPSLVAEYRRQGQSSWTTITLASKTLGTYTSGGIVADGSLSGAYEFDPPDAALAAGARFVAIRLRGATNMLPVLIEIELDAVNYQDATRFGLSALPNAAASASGGLPTVGSGSGQIALTSGGVNVVTNSDKTGYSLTQAFPTNFSSLAINASGHVILQDASLVTAKLGTFTLAKTTNITGFNDIAATAIVSGGAITTSGGAVSSVTTVGTVNALAANSVNASALASDAVGEIADGVWDEPIAGHLTAGSTGNALNAAGSAGDPWSTPLPGAYGSGTAGNIVGNNLNATVSSRLASSAVPANFSLLDIDASGFVELQPASLTTAKLGTFVLAKTTNITGFNDIAATSIVSGGAITTSGGAVSTVASVNGLAANSITASALATDAVSEIADGVWDEAIAGHLTAGSTGLVLNTAGTDATAIKAKTDQITLTNANKVDAAILAEADFATIVANKVADILLRRTMANVEASSNGDALSLGSVYGFVQQAQESDTTASPGNLTVYRTDGSTVLGTKALTTNASAEPITGVS